MRRFFVTGLFAVAMALVVAGCVNVENKRTKESRHIRVRAPFTHVDVDVPKGDDDEDTDVDVRVDH